VTPARPGTFQKGDPLPARTPKRRGRPLGRRNTQKPLKVWTLEETQAWKDREWVKRRKQVFWRGPRKSVHRSAA